MKEAVRSEKCEVWTVKCEVWSVKFEVWSAKSAVWSVECEDFASSLAEKKNACRGKDTVGTGFSSNYRSFIFGKLPPPACPRLCYNVFTSMPCVKLFSRPKEKPPGLSNWTSGQTPTRSTSAKAAPLSSFANRDRWQEAPSAVGTVSLLYT